MNLKYNLQSIVIFILAVSSFIIHRDSILISTKSLGLKSYFYLILWFLVYALTIIYSSNPEGGLNRIVQQISFVLLPFIVIYALPTLNKRMIKWCYLVFILSNIIFSFYLDFHLLNNLNNGYLKGLSSRPLTQQVFDVFTSSKSQIFWYGLRDGESSTLFIHKTYFSSTFLFSSVLLVFLFFKEKSILLKSIIIFSIVYFGCHIYFYGSIPNTLLFLILIPITFFVFKKTKTGLIIGIVLGVSLVSGYIYMLNKKATTDNDLFTKVMLNKLNVFTNFFSKETIPNLELDDRTIIYGCAYNLFSEKPIIGYGIENYQNELNECYLTYNRLQMALRNINPHNHFYVMLLSGGLLLLSVFLVSLLYLFHLCIKHKDFLFFAFLIIIVTNCFIEAYLSRINGILFFTLFVAIYLKKCMLKRNNITLDFGNIL
ncbi:MAG: O-antigen ligase family protein [Flavobacteriaceae bacterium]